MVVATLRPDGSLLVSGPAAAIQARLAGAGITSVLKMPGGVLVGRSQARRAQAVLLAAAQPAATAGVQDAAPAAGRPAAEPPLP